jgi:hypothetical protein
MLTPLLFGWAQSVFVSGAMSLGSMYGKADFFGTLLRKSVSSFDRNNGFLNWAFLRALGR